MIFMKYWEIPKFSFEVKLVPFLINTRLTSLDSKPLDDIPVSVPGSGSGLTFFIHFGLVFRIPGARIRPGLGNLAKTVIG